MKTFILVAYKFPPYDQVGSLRWTKLSKYLARKGHIIHVVTVDWEGIGNAKTLNDVNHPNIKIHVIPSGYPHKLRYKNLNNRYLNFLKSLPFRLFLDRFICFDDEAQLWKKSLLKKLEDLTNQFNIDTVVTTGGPFQAMRWTSLFKKLSKKRIKLIHDFRDPWAFDPFKSLTASQKIKVIHWQKECLEAADHVVAVTSILLKEYLHEISSKEKGTVITNGFDSDSLPTLDLSKKNDSKEIKLCHAGNIANGRERPLMELLNALNKNEFLREHFAVTLVGDLGLSTTTKLSMQFPELIKLGKLTFIKRLPQNEVFQLIASSAFALHLNGPELPCANSTKIFEYGMMKKPTVSLNYGGEVDQLIRNHDLGFSINLNHEGIEDALTSIAKSPAREFKIDVSEFSHARLADKYSNLINSL